MKIEKKHTCAGRAATVLLISALGATGVKAETEEAIGDTLQMKELVVTGARGEEDIRHLPQTVTVVDRATLTGHERTNILPTLTEQVPGLMATGRGVMGYGVSGGHSGDMMLRGISSTAGQVMVLIDGQPQYNGIYGHPIGDAYQTMIAERVEVLRGPASVLYGSNAMGGVVNIVTRGMSEDGVRTNVNVGAGSYGTVQAEATNRVRKGRFSSTVAAQYSRSDNHRPRMGFEQYGGFVKLGYDFGEHWKAYADADVTHFNASYPGTVDAPMLEADQWITRTAVSVGVENRYERSSGRISLYDNFGRHKLNDGHAVGASPQKRLFRSRDALAGVSWYQSANLWTGIRLTVGFDYQNIYGHAYYTSRETGEVMETPNKQSGEERSHEVAAYADLRQDLLTWLTIDAGVRYDHHSVSGGEWVPQAGVVVRPMDDAEVKAMAGKGFRNPTMREMYLYPPSNTDLLPERMWSYELSWKHRLPGGRLRYGVNLFYIKADNIIQTVNRKNINTGELENMGVEAEAAFAVNSHWDINTNHSWLHMEHKVLSAPQYKGYVGASMRYGRWSAGAGLMQVCGMYTSLEAGGTKENFTLLNATASYRACSHVRLWAKAENILAQRYEYLLGMPMPKATFMGGVSLDF